MKIAILGSRGIPNYYGGFEQFTEYLAQGLVLRGHDISVYSSANHPYQESEWNGVKIVHERDPEHKLGTLGQFIYDLNCILHSRKQNFDIILQLGYTSNGIWGWLLSSDHIITTNMDGLEWKRTKYSKPVQQFLKFSEKLAVKFSDYLIADSIGIQQYLSEKYKKDSVYIPYGANPFADPDTACLENYKLVPYGYDMLIARLEPENSIEIILQGVKEAGLTRPFLVIGNDKSSYGKYLKKKFGAYANINFLGGIYNMSHLNNLRYYSNLYFHGHTVGGTNPSLLEAMASGALICAHDNLFNASILSKDAFYFRTNSEVSTLLINLDRSKHLSYIRNNFKKISDIFNWNEIIGKYEKHFFDIIKAKHNTK